MDVNPISEKKPFVSMSMGCHPSQVKEFNDKLKKMGVRNAHYQPNGHPIAYSKKGKNALMKAQGLVNRDGGFGDYTGASR